MHILQQEYATHKEGKAPSEEEHRVQVEHIRQLGQMCAAEMEQAAKAEEDAGDQARNANCSVHRMRGISMIKQIHRVCGSLLREAVHGSTQ